MAAKAIKECKEMMYFQYNVRDAYAKEFPSDNKNRFSPPRTRILFSQTDERSINMNFATYIFQSTKRGLLKKNLNIISVIITAVLVIVIFVKDLSRDSLVWAV